MYPEGTATYGVPKPSSSSVQVPGSSKRRRATGAEIANASGDATYIAADNTETFPRMTKRRINPGSPWRAPQVEFQEPTWSDAGAVQYPQGDTFSAPKFPFNDDMFYFPYGPPAVRPMSSASSVTYSPTSSAVSATLSMPPDCASETSPPPTVSCSPRGPSPLCNVVNQRQNDSSKGKYVCLVSECSAKFSREEDLELHARTAHVHVCLWGDEGRCDSPGFATREELNWHVKREHLFICPVLGCKEGTFQSKELVDCHIKYRHCGVKLLGDNTGSSTNGLLQALTQSVQPKMASSEHPPQVDSLKAKVESAEDRVLKMQQSIGLSKKRCQEKLRAVVDRRAKGHNNQLPGAVGHSSPNNGGITSQDTESPGASANRLNKLINLVSFPIIWEHGVLPFLIEFMPKWCGPGHVISVTRGRKPNTRRICIMTKGTISKARRVAIAGHVRDLLPENYRNLTTFVFSTGEVDRLTWARGLGKGMSDEVCIPRNPFCYVSPCMGDSIGATLEDGDEVTATLGPCLTIGGGSYWLANFHPFVEISHGTGPMSIEHPSPEDRSRCLDERHDVLSSDLDNFQIGSLTATSGYDLKTTRLSHDPFWEECDMEPPLVVTDWTLISARTRQANMLRKFPATVQRKETPVTLTSSVTPGATVCSTGRTSGHQRGQICEVPAYIDGTKAGNGTGKATREWFVEEPDPYNDEDAWIRGGIGVPGDSGAGLIDCGTNALVGQVWGRNKYWGPGPRLTFFTPILDIIDDIQEKCGEQTRPQLPQHRDEGDCLPAYPICRQCFDLREYLDSRRTSRESLMSMIGLHDGPAGENDHDITSVSELATPKDQAKTPRDNSYLVRHIGPEESGSSFGGVLSPASFGSVVSPAPIHTFLSPPGAVEIRTPYAPTLSDEDLCDSKCAPRNDVALGKRPAAPVPLRRSGSQQSGKRQRIL